MAKRQPKGLIILLIAGILIVLAVSSFLIYLRIKPIDDLNNQSNNNTNDSPVILKGENGVTINIWFHDTEKLDSLKDRNVTYLFVDVGDTGKNGKIKTSEEEIDIFLEFIKEYEQNNDVDFIVLPYSETILEDYDFSAEFQKNYALDYINLVNKGFDGVHVDIEAIPTDKQDEYLNLLGTLKKGMGKDKTLSLYSGAISSSPNTWEWTAEFFKKVGARVDIISIQGYDFDLDTKEEYQTHLAEQMERISALNLRCKLLLTIPTHNPSPETVGNALEVYHDEIVLKKNKEFSGVNVFAEWTTSDSEWNVYDSYFENVE